jgi:hypothetical protein
MQSTACSARCFLHELSVAYGEAPAGVLGRFGFVDDGDCQIFYRNPAFALGVEDRPVAAIAELAGDARRAPSGSTRAL